MNLFPFHSNPIESARMACDSHVVKLPTECIQMLACGFSRDVLDTQAPKNKEGNPYKTPKHIQNHPVTKWVLSDFESVAWTMTYARELIKEKKYRFGGEHHAEKFLNWCVPALMTNLKHQKPVTPLPTCFPEDYVVGTTVENICEAYRYYFSEEKQHIHKWTKRIPPEWVPLHRRLNSIDVLYDK